MGRPINLGEKILQSCRSEIQKSVPAELYRELQHCPMLASACLALCLFVGAGGWEGGQILRSTKQSGRRVSELKISAAIKTPVSPKLVKLFFLSTARTAKPDPAVCSCQH